MSTLDLSAAKTRQVVRDIVLPLVERRIEGADRIAAKAVRDYLRQLCRAGVYSPADKHAAEAALRECLGVTA